MKNSRIIKYCLFILLALFINVSYAEMSYFSFGFQPEREVIWVPGHWYNGYWVPGQYVEYQGSGGAFWIQGGGERYNHHRYWHDWDRSDRDHGEHHHHR